MKSLILKWSLAAGLTALVIACGGGGGGFAGIGGSGFIATGTVTGFGSVFVNGVEFETGSAIFEIEDGSGSEQDLRIGMVVQVQGSVNADGVTGSASAIRYADQLEGPISSISTNTDQTVKTLNIFGISVVVNSADTMFEDITFGSLLAGYVVEVSGFYDDNGVLQASFLELKAQSYNAATLFELRGVIDGLSGSRFNLRGVNVNAAGANLEDLPNGLQNGVSVEVDGTYDSNSHTLTATRVEGDEISYRDDGSEVSIEGYITRFNNVSDFDIDGYPVNASTATREPATLQLVPGARVEAEGSVSNGVLIAHEIEARGGDAEVSAPVHDVDLANGSFRVEVVSGYYVTVQTSSSTLMKDDVGADDNLSLSELVPGSFVEVRGSETDASTIAATRVKRIDPEKIELQGVVTDQVQDVSITVLGVVFQIDGQTEFEDESEAPLNDHQDFINNTRPGISVVSIEDKQAGDGNPVGVADSVEIEIY